ncbi:hypothetical protein ACLKOZ_19705 [Arthrobacter sp. R4]|uniref:hypothetical protein n=1 Tax=Arthrobacter sp. R4 TaxID=644417 RepID=UPI003EDA1DC3
MIVAMMLLFRIQLSRLLGNIAGRIPTVSEITGPGNIALKFEQELKEVKGGLPPEVHETATKNQDMDTGGDSPGSAISFLRRIDALAKISPRAAVLEAYLRVETAAAKVVAEYAPQVRRGPIHSMLHGVDAVPHYLVTAAAGLSRLRNEAAHAEDFSIPVESVREYASTALDVSRGLDEMLAPGSDTFPIGAVPHVTDADK